MSHAKLLRFVYREKFGKHPQKVLVLKNRRTCGRRLYSVTTHHGEIFQLGDSFNEAVIRIRSLEPDQIPLPFQQ